MTKVQRIDPKTVGRGPLDIKAPVFDPLAVARADAVLEAMSGSFQEWLERDVERLQKARLAGERLQWHGEAFEALHLAAHDIKGLGTTYGYPLVTQMAASLCRLVETPEGKHAARAAPDLIGAHVDALRASVRDRIKSDEHPVGRALLTALEARVDELGVAPR